MLLTGYLLYNLQGLLEIDGLSQRGSTMNFLHYEVDAGSSNTIQVTLDQQANVRLLDGMNFQKYSSGEQHRYFGGLAEASPINLRPPHAGHWHVVIDLGGYSGTVRASVQVL